MKSLFELSFFSWKISFEEIMTKDKNSIERIYYDKIVDLTREKITKALRTQKTTLILFSIYFCRKNNVNIVINLILGNLTNYKKSLWRLAMVHAVSSYVSSNIWECEELGRKADQKRINDVISTIDFYFPYNETKEKQEVLIRLLYTQKYIHNNIGDIYQYIEIYYSFGKYLIPFET